MSGRRGLWVTQIRWLVIVVFYLSRFHWKLTKYKCGYFIFGVKDLQTHFYEERLSSQLPLRVIDEMLIWFWQRFLLGLMAQVHYTERKKRQSTEVYKWTYKWTNGQKPKRRERGALENEWEGWIMKSRVRDYTKERRIWKRQTLQYPDFPSLTWIRLQRHWISHFPLCLVKAFL